MSPPSALTLTLDRDVAVLALQRPERRNALSLDLMREMISRLDEIDADSDIRAVIVSGAGKVFCAGHDLSEIIDAPLDALRTLFETSSRLMRRLQSLSQPVIAEVGGLATAAGCQLVAACDLAVASTDAAFATPGVRIGLFCSTPAVTLSRTIGRKRAMQMLLTGETVDAYTAEAWGLVNRVVAPDVLRTETRLLARGIAKASPYTLAIGKRTFHAQAEVDLEAAYTYASEVMAMNAMADDAREGMRAFLEKRTPTWVGH